MNITILDSSVLDPGDIDWSPISSLGNTTIYKDTPPERVVERSSGADVLILNKVRLRDGIQDAIAPTVKLICLLATGYDNVDGADLARRNVPVCNVVAYGIDDVAQHTIALMLELCRNIGGHAADVRAGGWARRDWCYWLTTPVVVRGLTMGIIGFGAIGRRVGELAHAFGMNVLGCCRSRRNPPSYAPFAFASEEEVFKNADIISLHCPLTDQTRAIIRRETIAKMKDGVRIINAARGPLLNEADCAEALRSGKIAGLACDVLVPEPPAPDNPLVLAPNTVITPHMAWASHDSRQRIVDMTAQNIRAWMNGSPTNVVNGPLTQN